MLNKSYYGEFYAYHLCGKVATTPSINININGAGSHATVSIINGDDTSGIIQLVTSSLDVPIDGYDILTVTFSNVFSGGTPRVQIQPANPAAWTLAYGTIQIIDSLNSSSSFSLYAGNIPLPAYTSATYEWSYMCIGRST